MGTRSILAIKDDKNLKRIYRHYDGYPTYGLGDLVKVFEQLKRKTLNQVVEKYCEIGGARVEHESKNLALNSKNLGNQGDLEWLYVIDLKKKTIDIFGGGYKDILPSQHIKNGTVNPHGYVYQLIDEAQDEEFTRTTAVIDNLKNHGFKVNGDK